MDRAVRSTRASRVLKRQLGNNGVIYCKRVRGTTSDVGSALGRPNTMQSRTTEAGLVPQRAILTSNVSRNAMERAIQANDGHISLTRFTGANLAPPNAQYYHNATDPSTFDAADVARHPSSIRNTAVRRFWDYAIPPAQWAIYYMAQGNLLRPTRYYHVVQIPAVLTSIAASMTYRNVSLRGLLGYNWAGFQFVFCRGSEFALE